MSLEHWRGSSPCSLPLASLSRVWQPTAVIGGLPVTEHTHLSLVRSVLKMLAGMFGHLASHSLYLEFSIQLPVLIC